MRRAQFNAEWTRSAILLRPGPSFKDRRRAGTLKSLAALLLHDKATILAVTGLGGAATIAGFAMAWVAKGVFDGLAPGLESAGLASLATAALALAGIVAASGAARSLLLARLALRIEARMGDDFTRRILRQELGFFLRQGAGDIFSRFADVTAIQASITGVALSIAFDSAVLAVCGLALGFYDATLTAAAVPFFLGACLCASLPLRHLMAAERNTRRRASDFATRFIDCLMNIRAVKAFSAESWMLSELQASYWQSRSCAARRTLLYQLVGASVGLLSNLGVITVLIFGAYLAARAHVTVGELVMFYAGVGLAFGPLQRLAPSLAILQAGLTGIERLSIADTPPGSSVDAGAAWSRRTDGNLNFEGVTYWYRRGGPVLQEVSLECAGGLVLAVVGHTGSGKSTLAQLASGLLRPCKGEVYLDGLPLSRFDLGGVRSCCVLAPTDPGLMAGSVRDNITFGLERATDSQVEEAARLAGADSFICKLPRSYGHIVGTGGNSLSSGQRQRLGVARAILRDPDLLVLDEATSALDPASETALLAALLESRRGRTTIIITHRPSAAAAADRVALLDRGRLAGFGAHKELLAHSVTYRQLWAPADAIRETARAAVPGGAGPC